uniref:Transportin-3 n=1 Tax=Ciona savignyi TaxID=51511 RepID=H2ZAX9_CIOSA
IMAVSQNATNVLQAVTNLYHNPNPAEKEKASKWLGEFQRSVFAWETADQLLRLKNDVESTYFAAQTMRTKILFSFRELPPETHDSLRESLLSHIEQLAQMSPILTTQLCLAVSNLALQMPSWKMPAVTFIQKYGKDQSSLTYLLELLTVLPEEVNNKSLRLGSNRRSEIIDQMEDSAPMVVELLKTYIGVVSDEKILAKIFKCLGSWFYLGVLPGNHVARCKLLDVPFSVMKDVSMSSSLYEAACGCICAALFSTEDVTKNSDLVHLLFEGTHSLRDAYHNAIAHEDTDKCLNLCRVFTELAESLLEMLVNMPGDGLGDLVTLDLLLLCNGHCQYEVAEITFNLWYRMSEMLYSSDEDTVRRVFGPYIERLVCSLVRHCQMEPDNDKILDENDDFSDFRSRAAELVRDVVFLVGPTECFIHLFSMLTSTTWDVTGGDHCFIMTSIVQSTIENTVVPQVLQAVLSLPPDTHIAVRHTSVKLVGELSAWIEKHPEMLDHTLQFLTSALQCQELASVAATSLQYLCEVSYQHMAQHYSALLQLIQVSDDLKVSTDATLGLLKGVVTVLSHLPTHQIKEAVVHLCSSQVTVLSQQINENSSNSGHFTKDPTTWLDRLAAIFRNVKITSQNGSVHPCKEPIEQMWPVLKCVLEKIKSENRIVERWCRCMRFAVRCAGRSIQNTMLSEIAGTITSNYSTDPHSCFLYLGSILVDEYGNDASLSTMLSSFAEPTFKILNEENGLSDNPDTVDDLFRLCSRFLEKCPTAFLSHPACPALIDCALVGLKHEHRDANASVTKFLRSVIECRIDDSSSGDGGQHIIEQVINSYGGQIVEQSLQACLFHIPTYMYPDIAELWWAIIERNRQAFSAWFMSALKNLPTEATLATATPEQTMQFHAEVIIAAEWKNVSYHLRDFCRLYR